ncbi:MAG: hypothetical protein KA104_02010 [Candidatus Pacebacteria bacterium]|nr:hypothetical protein [Candidatus Paceibacterota bacterium]
MGVGVAYSYRENIVRELFSIPLIKQGMLEHTASGVVDTCKDAAYRPGCYEREIPLLMDNGLSMENAFIVTGLVQKKDPTYIYCHVLGHDISAKETAKDPSRWTSVMAQCPQGMCANGCLHGSVQQRFRNDSLTESEISGMVPELVATCEFGNGQTFTAVEQAVCYHGLGHLGMYATGGKVNQTLDMCDALASRAQNLGSKAAVKTRCYGATFMQIFQFLDEEDRALVKDIAPKTREAADRYCAQFAGEREAACHSESWPLSIEEIKTPEGAKVFCEYSSNPGYRQTCYNMVFASVTDFSNYNQSKITSFCEELPSPRMAHCFARSASRFIETSQRLGSEAVAMCKIASSKGVGERCYKELLYFSTHNYHVGTDAFTKFCSLLPDPWKQKCLAGEGDTLPIVNDE